MACEEAHRWLRKHPLMLGEAKEGAGDKHTLDAFYACGGLPLGNWEVQDASWDQVGSFEGAEKFWDQYAIHQYGCFGCPVNHFHVFQVPGVGIGMTGHTDAGEQVSNEYVQLDTLGTVTVYCCATEFGTGTRDVVRMIAAEALNVPLENVVITPPDTLVNPWEWGSTGSRSTYAMGSAVLEAAKIAKSKLFEKAAQQLGVKPDELDTKNSLLFV